MVIQPVEVALQDVLLVTRIVPFEARLLVAPLVRLMLIVGAPLACVIVNT